jgi:hypothetical protein
MRLPALTVGEYRLALDPSSGRLYASRSARPLGSVSVAGIYRPREEATKLDITSVRALVERTLDVVKGAALLSGDDARCALCGIPLGKSDRPRGIGPKCWEKGQLEKLEETKTRETTKYKRSAEWPYVKRKKHRRKNHG